MPSPQSSIFSKSNLFYVPLSITIAHTLNFIVNSPSSTWHEFPPKLPNSVYSSIFFAPLFLFISLTFEPIQKRIRFYTLLFLALIFISIPLIFRGKYSASLQNFIIFIATQEGLKMLMFLKLNRVYLKSEKSDQKKEFKPYLWTLFNWRFNSYIIPPQSENSNERENPLIIKSSQINKKLINRLIITIAKWLMYELAFFFLVKYDSRIIPENAYQVRLMKFITKGILPVTMTSMLHYLNFFVLSYIRFSLYYDIFTIIVTIIFRSFFYSTKIDNPVLIRLGFLTPSEYISLNEWFITFIFNTKHIYDEPWMASSPRDLWSARWQLLLNEIFKELGYLPVKNLIVSIVPRKFANIMGVLGAFGVSALLHEYIVIAQFDIWTGEHFFFFMIHGVVMILWEVVFGYEKKNKITKIERFLKWVLLAVINLLLLPAYIEPMRIQYCDMPSYFTQSCKVN